VTLVVTGASGGLGRRVAHALSERGAAADVVLVTRAPEAAERDGMQLRAGDFDDPASLDAAFAGGERLLLISSSAVGRRMPQHLAALEAAARAGVEHVIYTSLLHPEDNPAIVMDEHRRTEEALTTCGMAWTVLRNGIYAEAQVPRIAEAIADGRLLHNQDRGRTAYVARDDCARVAAAVLDAGGHEGQVLEVTGPEAIGAAALAAIASAVTGVSIAAVHATDDQVRAAGLAAGQTPERVEFTVTMGQAVRQDLMDGVTDVVRRVSGRAPLPLRAVLEANIDALLPDRW
jgi:NAD(P)H dehydrogenase (quinone)